MRHTLIMSTVLLAAAVSVSSGQDYVQHQLQVTEQAQVNDQAIAAPQVVPTQATQTVQLVPQVGAGQPGQPQLAYFSPRLGARFVLQKVQIGGFAPVTAARIVSTPYRNSPLSNIGLKIGDVITRLDGIPIGNYRQLEQHVYDTKVRFVKAGQATVRSKTTWIRPNQYFQETFYAPDPPEVCPTTPSQPILRP